MPKCGAPEKNLFQTETFKMAQGEYNQSANITTQVFVNLRLSVCPTTQQIYVQKQVAEIKLAPIDISRNVDIMINAGEEVPVSIAMMTN